MHEIGLKLVQKISLTLERGPLVAYSDTQAHSKRVLPCGLFHPYKVKEPISNIRDVWCTFFIFILFRIEIPVKKQYIP